MINYELLSERIESSGITKTAIANKMGISREALYQKLQGKSDWTLSNVEAFSKALFLTDAETKDIFFV